MSVAIAIQLAFALAAVAAVFSMIKATDTRRARLAQGMFGVFIAGSTLTQAVVAHERAKAGVAEKVSQLDELAVAQSPNELTREGRELIISAIEGALGSGLGLHNLALLILGGVLLGMGLGQLLELYRSRERSLVFRPEGAE